MYLKYYYNVNIEDCYMSTLEELVFSTHECEMYYTDNNTKIVYIIDL